MSGKKTIQYLFEVELNWLGAHKGILISQQTEGPIYITTPVEFGGEGGNWSPEHLFLGSVSGCFMSTYLSFVQKLRFDISRLECSVIGHVEKVEERLQFTTIHLYPKIYIATEDKRAKAEQALAHTHKHCLISNSLSASVYYHSEVLLDPHPSGKTLTGLTGVL